MANERRLIVLDYETVREAFNEEFKETMQLIKNGETHLDNLAEGFTEADRVLRKMSSVDAVEVVRCKDCKCMTPVEGGLPLCCQHNTACAYDDFCSYGEKRESGTQPQREVSE